MNASIAEQITQMLYLAVLFSGIPLLAVLWVGLTVGVFQAATQIQEQSVQFVLKLAAVGTTYFFLGHWMFTELNSFFQQVIMKWP